MTAAKVMNVKCSFKISIITKIFRAGDSSKTFLGSSYVSRKIHTFVRIRNELYVKKMM